MRLTERLLSITPFVSRRKFKDVLTELQKHQASGQGELRSGERQGTEEERAITRANEYESAGQHDEAIKQCERALSDSTSSQLDFCFARNLFKLASEGQEQYVYLALLFALSGIDKRSANQPDSQFAIGIIKWCLEYFSDRHRIVPRSDNEIEMQEELTSLHRAFLKDDIVSVSDSLFRNSRLIPTYGRSKDALRKESAFLLAQLLTRVDPRLAVEMLASHTYPLPGPHDIQLFEDYLYSSAAAKQARLKALNRAIPSFLITSLPKSASEFLSYAIAQALDIPVIRVSIGRPYRMCVYGPWIKEARLGGCVTHDHFSATIENISELRAGGADKIVVLVRDPRAAAWSLLKMQNTWRNRDTLDDVAWINSPPRIPASDMNKADKSFCDAVHENCEWIMSWLKVTTSRDSGLSVQIVKFQDLTKNVHRTVSSLADFVGASSFTDAILSGFLKKQQAETISNYRSGDDNEWRRETSKELHTILWKIIPEQIKTVLDLE
jgi:tetratricopeptide (TPR) repeat protein